MIDPADHLRVIEERNELGRQNDRYEKALREIVEYMGPRCTGNSAADARDMCCIAEEALRTGGAEHGK